MRMGKDIKMRIAALGVALSIVSIFGVDYIGGLISPQDNEYTLPLKPEYVRDQTILYLRDKGILTKPLTATWSGSRETPEGLVGSETYLYRAGELVVTIKYPVVLPENTIYKITVESEGSIVWEGQLFRGQFTP